MTIAWAGIERMLDELIAWYQHYGTGLEAEHPRALSNKLKYLRLMQRDERLRPEVREFLRLTRIEGKRLGDERHDLIHGLLHLSNGPASMWRTQRVVYNGPFARLTQRLYTDHDLQRISREITEFGGNLSPKVWAIIGGDPRLIAAHKLENAKRELGMT